jgi:hypothetical protein
MFLHYCAHAYDRHLSYVNHGAGEQYHLDRPAIGLVSREVEGRFQAGKGGGTYMACERHGGQESVGEAG